MNKLKSTYQSKWSSNPLYSRDILMNIGQRVQLHTELENVLSSAAACLNVLGNLSNDRLDLIKFLNCFGLEIQELIPFPTGTNIAGEIYDDEGYVVFEWIGPGKSTINERGGKRGQNRTSIDAFVLAKINGKTTQLLIEWKFSEAYGGKSQLQKFAGIAGNERLRRYSSVLAKLRKSKEFPFDMEYEGGWGLYDLGYEPLYQLLRMTLLANTTTPLQLSDRMQIEDYRILHLSHSENMKLNTVTKSQLKYCVGLTSMAGSNLHELWGSILAPDDSHKFNSGYWNLHLNAISDPDLKDYLCDRYA